MRPSSPPSPLPSTVTTVPYGPLLGRVLVTTGSSSAHAHASQAVSTTTSSLRSVTNAQASTWRPDSAVRQCGRDRRYPRDKVSLRWRRFGWAIGVWLLGAAVVPRFVCGIGAGDLFEAELPAQDALAREVSARVSRASDPLV